MENETLPRLIVVRTYASWALPCRDAGLGYNAAWQPQITNVISSLSLGNSLQINGSGFRGVSEASGGNGAQDSPADFPLLQLRSLTNGQTVFVSPTNWSATSFTSMPITNFPVGPMLATVFVNGIPSRSSLLSVAVSGPFRINVAAVLNDASAPGAYRVTFTNVPNFSFSVLATTNLATPVANWTVLGTTVNGPSPGQYQFIDLQAPNFPVRFYIVRWP